MEITTQNADAQAAYSKIAEMMRTCDAMRLGAKVKGDKADAKDKEKEALSWYSVELELGEAAAALRKALKPLETIRHG
jgi:hypothetical protein